jgi:PAS domain S-box-containing protein
MLVAHYRKSTVFKRPSVIGWVVFLLLFVTVVLLSYQRYLLFKEARKSVLATAALNARDKLKNVLDFSSVATRTLGFMVIQEGGKTNFDTVARKLLDSYKYVDALELVQGGTITNVYPLAENAAAIGYDILRDSLVNKEAERAIREKKLFYAGPLPLKQGYVGIVGRLPLFINDKFWGFSAAIVKLSTLIRAAQLDSGSNKDYIFQLSKVNPNTGEEQFFLPHDGAWGESDWESVAMAEGDWKIYARFVNNRTAVALLPFMILGLLFSVFGGLFAWYGAGQPYRLQQLVSEKTRQLKASEERYFSFFEKASDAIIVINAAGVIAEVNNSVCKLLQFSREELVGRNFSALVDPLQVAVDPFYLNFQQQGKELLQEIRLARKDGGFVEIELSVKKIDGDHHLAIGRDLTGLREAQKQVAISESTLRGAFEHSAIGMALVSSEGKWLKVNKALCQMLGYLPEEMAEMSFKDITHPQDQQEGIQFMTDALQKDAGNYRTEKRYICKGGAVIWVNLNVSAVRDGNGRLLYFVTQTEDITEKKKITELLQVREQQLRLFVEYSPAALAMFDKDMRYLMASKRWLSDYGLEGRQVIGRIHYELFPDNPQRWRDIHRRCMNGETAKSEEDFYVDENGKTIWLRWEVHPWRHYNGDIGGIILFTEVITRLKEAEIKFRNLVERSPVGVCIIQGDRFAYVNPEFAEIFGYSQQEMASCTPAAKVLADESRYIFSYPQGNSTTDDAHFMQVEAIGERKDGQQIFLGVYGTVATYEGRPALMCTLMDITERKTAEYMIRDSEEKRRMIMDAALDAIIGMDERGVIVAWNPQAEIVFGWSEQEVLGQLLADKIIPVQYREKHRKGMEHYLKTGDGPILQRLIEVSAINKMGEEFPVELTIIPVTRQNETTFTAFLRDISERKRTQNKLKESEEKFRNLVEKSLAGVYILQEGKVVYINPAHQRIMGYSLQELKSMENIESLVHEADIPHFRAYHQPGSDTAGHQNQYVLRALRKDGRFVYLEIVTSEIIYEGRPAWIGTLLDITSRIEEEIRIGRAVNEAQEKERMQIGMELHDNVKQIMAASLLTVDFVRGNLSDTRTVTEALDNLKKYTIQAIDELRRLSHRLAPATDVKDSFRDQIEYLVATMNTDDGLKTEIHVTDQANNMPTEVRTAFYRIVQEQLNNISKYAKASNVSIRVETNKKGFTLLVRDDGQGFDSSLRNDGIGLTNIRRRAFVLGGIAKITSRPGKGCQIMVFVPAV